MKILKLITGGLPVNAKEHEQATDEGVSLLLTGKEKSAKTIVLGLPRLKPIKNAGGVRKWWRWIGGANKTLSEKVL